MKQCQYLVRMRFFAILVARHSLMIAHFARPRHPLEHYILTWRLTICAEQDFRPAKVEALPVRGRDEIVCTEQGIKVGLSLANQDVAVRHTGLGLLTLFRCAQTAHLHESVPVGCSLTVPSLPT